MKKLLSFLMIAALLLTVLPVTAFAAETAQEAVGDQSGATGNCTWSFDSSTGTLTVSGSGAMADYNASYDYEYEYWSSGTMPWWNFRSQIKSVVIGNGVTAIGTYAFFGCSNLKSLTIGSGVTTVKYDAFANCGLSEVTIPATVTTIGNCAFGWILNPAGEDCALDNFTIYGDPGSAAEEYAHRDEIFTFTFVAADHTAWDFDSTTGTLTVSGSGAMADYNASYDYEYEYWSSGTMPWWSIRSQIKSVVIGDGVTSIGTYAFFGCSNLKSLTIGRGVTTVKYNAFANCGLSEVTIPATVTTIGNRAFGWRLDPAGEDFVVNDFTIYGESGSAAEEYAGRDEYLQINFVPISNVSGTTGSCTWELDSASGILTVSGSGAMANYTDGTTAPWYSYADSITEIVIENGVTAVGNHAFEYLENVNALTIGSGVKTIGDYAFYNCSGMTELSIADTVTSIGDHAFSQCGITDLTLPDNMATFGKGAFSSNPLTSVTLPASMVTVPEAAFENCRSLTGVSYGSNVTTIGKNAFAGCGFTSLELPDTVTAIDNYGFSGCKFTDLTIPETVNTIGHYAFNNTPTLQTVIIPSTVTDIGLYAFGYYTYLNGSGSVVTDKNSPFTIYGTPGTAAETYASENGFTFQRFVKKYDLWLGSTQVTDDNKNNILGDRLTWFDTDDNTLYVLSSEITGTHGENGVTAKIFSAIPNLTVWGAYEMAQAEGDAGLVASNGVTLEGNFTFIGTKFGIQSTGALTFNSGESVCTGGVKGIASTGSVNITNGIRSVRSNGPVYGANGITLGDMISITSPEGAVVDNGTVKLNGETAASVTFELVNNVIETVAITGVDAPVSGAYPSLTPMGGEGYNVMAEWIDADTGEWVYDTFVSGHQYAVILTIDAQYGYEFAENLTATVDGNAAEVGIRDGFEPQQARKVTYVFPRIDAGEQGDEVITSFNITGVTFPYANRPWDYKATVPATMTLDSVKLYDSNGAEISKGTSLEKNATYWGEITVTAKEGYCFEYDSLNGWNLYSRVNFTDGSGAWASPMQSEESMSGSTGTGKTVSLRWRMTPTEDAPILIGDANGDGIINIRDVTAIQRHLAEYKLLTGDAFLAADVNQDGYITIEDVTLLQRYLAEFISELA